MLLKANILVMNETSENQGTVYSYITHKVKKFFDFLEVVLKVLLATFKPSKSPKLGGLLIFLPLNLGGWWAKLRTLDV
jgi:hypothetical protein